MPVVTRLNIAPVRSLGLESRDEIVLTEAGVAEDRRFYLVDDSGRLVDQLIAASLVQVATWTDPDATVLRITLPDGTVIEDEVRLGDPIETDVHGRTAIGHLVDGPWGAALEEVAERAVRVVRCDRIGGTRTQHPATLVTNGSLVELGRQMGAAPVDARRFRMLIELDGDQPHVEDTWVGCRVGLGETILEISAPVPRCAMTTHDPNSGVRDLDTLRGIKDYRGVVNGKDIMFGVWGEVLRAGTIRVGDAIRIVA